MAVSVFDLFKIGIGPSSSHTVGPMRAARMFVARLRNQELLPSVRRVKTELFGSLGATGKGHGSDKAVILGLHGETPEQVDTGVIPGFLEQVRFSCRLMLLGDHVINYDEQTDIIMHRRKSLPAHPNGMRMQAMDERGEVLLECTYYSVGGGFVLDQDAMGAVRLRLDETPQRYPFKTAAQLLELCQEHGLSISGLMLENERAWKDETEVCERLMHLWQVMRDCIHSGMHSEGILPGGMKVKRRAAGLYRKIKGQADDQSGLSAMDWVDLYALAVNEENAAGGRVVTAPTNGAAGIIPAVLFYYRFHCPGADDDAVVRFLLVAGAIGILYKENASISGAEVGCQGEVGSACSMAAGALAEVLGGTPEQVENAAEIGMEHNLGLTCDPIGGLVQVPCIERNAMAAVKAINAARIALRGDGRHFVSLDNVIKTMRDTGADMKTKYKETARGGLAVNVIEC